MKLECLRDIIAGSETNPSEANGAELPPLLAPAEIETPQRQLRVEQAIETGENYARLILQADLQYSSKALTTEMRRTFYNLLAAIDAWGCASGAAERAPRYSGDVGADLARLNVFVANQLGRLRIEQAQ